MDVYLSMKTRDLTLVALLASVYAVGSFIPGFPMIGFPSSKIDFVRSLEIGYGLVLGPILGPSTAFLGAVVGKTITGGGVGLFFTPLALVSSFMAASMKRKSLLNIKGWILSAILLSCLIIGWYATPTGRAAPLYPVFHFIGLGMILLFRERIIDYLNSREKRRLALGVLLCSYPSTMAGHMLGNLIFIKLFSPSPLFFMTILPVSIIERIVITVIATGIGTSLIMAVRDLFPDLMRET